jgi:hypothetical protein
LCDHWCEPLDGVVVRLYRSDSANAGRQAGATEILNDDAVSSRTARLLVETTTTSKGWFTVDVPDEDYSGGMDIDVRFERAPGPTDSRKRCKPVQVHAATLQPDWLPSRHDPSNRVATFLYTLPSGLWREVRSRLGVGSVCGVVAAAGTAQPVAGALVTAFDTDWLQHDTLGAAVTDADGRFRIDYLAENFKRTPLPHINIEWTGGPDLYFRVESASGTELLIEPPAMGRTPGRRNAGWHACVDLTVPPELPQSTPWDERRVAEVRSSLAPGRAPIARVDNDPAMKDVYFRPWELVLGVKAAELLAPELERRGLVPYRPDPEDPNDWRSDPSSTPGERGDVNGRLCRAKIPLRLYVLPRGRYGPVDVVAVARELRELLSRCAAERPAELGVHLNHVLAEWPAELGVHLNHVLFAEPFYQGGPYGPPVPWLPPPPQGPTEISASVNLTVLDTGLPTNWRAVHPDLQVRIQPDATDIDLLDEDKTPGLDTCAGHGLFICGLVRRMAPGLRVDPGRVLRSTGDGDDVSISLELAELVAPVINMSFGCHTEHNVEPPVLGPLIRSLVGQGTVVVAAAGNNHDGGTEDLFWPAAMDEVIAVGAWDSTQSGPAQRAFFSNYGPWVDVWAPGVSLLSTYVGNWGAATAAADWVKWSGTSFATPLVAAEVARLAAAGDPDPRNSLLNSLPDSPWPASGNKMAKLFTPSPDPTT